MRSVIICSNESRTKEILPCVDSGIHCSILTGGNSRLIAMQRMRRIFGPGPSIFIKNMAAIIERVYQVSKYEGREREGISASGTWLALSARFSRQLLHFTFRTT